VKATPLEFRFRFAIHALLYFGGFAFYFLPNTKESTWLVLTPWLDRTGLMDFSTATVALLSLAILLATLGTFLRTWGAAYLGSGIVQSTRMHGSEVLADGPYRRMRNPLYLGTFLHTFALALLMPPTGAAFTIITIGFFQLRLILAEEPFLTARLGQPYLDYCNRVPRILPSITPRVPASGARPHWLQAIFGEIYMIAVVISFAVFGWRYNAFLLTKCVLISLGISLVVRAAMPRDNKSSEA
jgi:protein-S-isoprenylcysteine O-methyltransferase Ste14